MRKDLLVICDFLQALVTNPHFKLKAEGRERGFLAAAVVTQGLATLPAVVLGKARQHKEQCKSRERNDSLYPNRIFFAWRLLLQPSLSSSSIIIITNMIVNIIIIIQILQTHYTT